MNQDIYLKLLKAGFPFRRCEHAVDQAVSDDPVDFQCCYCGQPCFNEGDRFYVMPTLDELIEQLGPNIELLVKRSPSVNPFWEAYKENGRGFSAEGKTPLEAVANLYLALK